MNDIIVSPSILAGDFANMEKSVRALGDWGADYVHCDVMDGVYVKNLTFGMPMIAAIKKISPLPLDVHLMITEPERYVAEFVRCGADIVTFHPDASKRPAETLDEIRALGAKAGIVINPNVSFDEYKHLLVKCDVLLVMSVYAGLGGQKFIPETLDTVRAAVKYIKENALDVIIEIDGGVGESNAAIVREAGVRMIVAGSAVYKSDDPARTVRVLRGER
ncbi:MAG: ribulose-phosphate 3-epimerase [Firmicutes bacterium]|uniref:Ribulose-phosphate 3-epimerase n=1 Tax=Candidatus Stercoripulliclostridium pullicola TaxID=2840953 RepID=A0A940DHA1_9FIRM|nr:ribulose-phosphate 3-epimerase [Candidatus Stercoripulliclostridium pullicola]